MKGLRDFVARLLQAKLSEQCSVLRLAEAYFLLGLHWRSAALVIAECAQWPVDTRKSYSIYFQNPFFVAL